MWWDETCLVVQSFNENVIPTRLTTNKPIDWGAQSLLIVVYECNHFIVNKKKRDEKGELLWLIWWSIGRGLIRSKKKAREEKTITSI